MTEQDWWGSRVINPHQDLMVSALKVFCSGDSWCPKMCQRWSEHYGLWHIIKAEAAPLKCFITSAIVHKSRFCPHLRSLHGNEKRDSVKRYFGGRVRLMRPPRLPARICTTVFPSLQCQDSSGSEGNDRLKLLRMSAFNICILLSSITLWRREFSPVLLVKLSA